MRSLIRHWVFLGMARGIAAFLGAFTLVNRVGQYRSANFDANEWWIDLGIVPAPIAGVFLALASVLLLFFAGGFLRGRLLPRLTQGVVGVLIAITGVNAIVFWILAARGVIHPGFWVPLSALLALGLLMVFGATLSGPALPRRGRTLLTIGSLAACMVLFPLAQMYCYGHTDYRRPADVIVVFGARTYADGKPSQALADRVRTACQLYAQGLAPYMVFSGGPGDGPVDEVHAMQAMALELGVPQSAITLDPGGLNTDLTVRNTVPIFERLGAHRVLAVSHFYHLPRVKMTYQRALGREAAVYTVPAKETYPLIMLPRYMAREVVALWAYYLHPLWHSQA